MIGQEYSKRSFFSLNISLPDLYRLLSENQDFVFLHSNIADY